MKILVQWTNGAILPVLIKKTSTISEISTLLRFACNPNEELIFYKKRVPLNPEETLENYKIKENEILEVFITPKPLFKKIENNSNIKSIILEAAKISDKRFNMMEKDFHILEPKKENSSDDESSSEFLDFGKKEINIKKSSIISSEPLPTFWNTSKSSTPISLNQFLLPNLDSIEEIGKYLEKNGWSSWMW